MPELRTEDCQKFLATHPDIVQLVRDRLGLTDEPELEEPDPSGVADEYRAYIQRAFKDSKNPKKWVRQQKFKLGSKTDKEHMNFGNIWPQYVPDGVVRTFWLRDTDHITVILVEHNGAIVAIDDASD